MRNSVLIIFLLLLCLSLPCIGESPADSVIAKVTTSKGPLKLRSNADEHSRILDEIPNGTCIMVLHEDPVWCQVSYAEHSSYCMREYLTFLREADSSLLNYRVLSKGAKGDDVTALKRRLQDLGYIRDGSQLTALYNDTAVQRVILFERQTGMTEDGIASQELQAYLFSENAPVCTQKLPQIRSKIQAAESQTRVICGCCLGEGCECCNWTGWIIY